MSIGSLCSKWKETGCFRKPGRSKQDWSIPWRSVSGYKGSLALTHLLALQGRCAEVGRKRSRLLQIKTKILSAVLCLSFAMDSSVRVARYHHPVRNFFANGGGKVSFMTKRKCLNWLDSSQPWHKAKSDDVHSCDQNAIFSAFKKVKTLGFQLCVWTRFDCLYWYLQQLPCQPT